MGTFLKIRSLSVLVISLGICGSQSQALVGTYYWGPCQGPLSRWFCG